MEWRLDRRGAGGKQGVIVMLQGTGCDAAWPRMSRYANAMAPDMAVAYIETYGVTSTFQRPAGAVEGDRAFCPEDYWKHHTVSQRVADVRQVIAELSRQPWFNGNLVVFGGSEGGAVAAQTAGEEPVIDTVVIMSTGLGLPASKFIAESMPPGMRPMVVETFERIRATPTSDAIFLGNSYRWWADTFDRVYANDLIKFDGPVLLVYGSKDPSGTDAPRATRDLFQKSGRTNLTYVEKVGWDHGMVDEAGFDHKPEVFAEIRDSIDRQLGR
ncbi:MAG TPA: alpha/beta hydrolase [Hyphomonadaceae bacterium]|nr:alpha/beta hydrolase [Hyphomonadaceae bacterium]